MIFEKLNADSTLKDFLDEAEKEKKSDFQQERKDIGKHADQWCKDNGYPVQERKYWKKKPKKIKLGITNFILP